MIYWKVKLQKHQPIGIRDNLNHLLRNLYLKSLAPKMAIRGFFTTIFTVVKKSRMTILGAEAFKSDSLLFAESIFEVFSP